MAKHDKRDKKGSAPIIRREEAAGGGHHGGAWKVAYADFVTAMMAFFLLMWLLNATTEDQRKGLADYFSPSNLLSHASSGTGQPFGGKTPFDQGAMVSDRGSVQVTAGNRVVAEEPADDPDAPSEARGSGAGAQATSLPAKAEPTPPARSEPAPPPRPAIAEAAARADQRAAEQRRFERAAGEIKKEIAGDPALAALAQQITVDVTPEGLRIQLLDQERNAMFSTGSAQPNEQAKLLIAKITPILMGLPGQVSVQGHTDAAPYPSPDRTNWELSAERANAARRMLADSGFPQQRIRDVSGRADRELLLPAQPLAAANRRVAITVLRQMPPAQPAPRE